MEINVIDDGNCMFRCVATFLNKDFTIADRFKNGRIKARKLDELENKKAQSLRVIVVEYLKLHKNKYENDIKYNDFDLYSNLDERIEKMSSDNELAGLLELKILSKILKINFNIYVKRECLEVDNECSSTYNLVATVGKRNNVCNLLLENQHYNFIIWS